MSLAIRLSAVIPNRANSGGCRTCAWVKSLSPGDRKAYDEWVGSSKSLAQLWEIAIADPDNPYPVSLTALRHHVRNHREP